MADPLQGTLITRNADITRQLETIHAMMKTTREAIYAEVIAVVEGRLKQADDTDVEVLVYDYPTYQMVMGMPVVTRADPRSAPHNMFVSTDWLHGYARQLGGASAFLVREQEARSGEFIGLVGFCASAAEDRMQLYLESFSRNPDHAFFGADYIPFRSTHGT